MKKFLSTVAAIVIAGAANAAVVSVSITSPATAVWVDYVGPGPIGNNSFNNDNAVYTMNENAGVTLAADLAVDGGTIAAGTKVTSHYVWFDPKKFRDGIADFTFDRKIIGIITKTGDLIASHSVLGLAGVTYLSPSLLGIEPGTGDTAAFSGNVLSVDWTASTPGDHIRVVTTAAVPVPAAGGLLVLGLAGLAALRRRKTV